MGCNDIGKTLSANFEFFSFHKKTFYETVSCTSNPERDKENTTGTLAVFDRCISEENTD